MLAFVAYPHLAQRIGATGSSAVFANDLTAGTRYILTAEAAVYVAQGAAPVASAGGTGNMLVAAGQSVLIKGDAVRNKVAVIQVTAGGAVTLTPVGD